jgi:hypothetical protein
LVAKGKRMFIDGMDVDGIANVVANAFQQAADRLTSPKTLTSDYSLVHCLENEFLISIQPNRQS